MTNWCKEQHQYRMPIIIYESKHSSKFYSQSSCLAMSYFIISILFSSNVQKSNSARILKNHPSKIYNNNLGKDLIDKILQKWLKIL